MKSFNGMFFSISFLLLIFSLTVGAESLPPEIPSTNGTIIFHRFYAFEYDEEHEISRWVAYELTREEVFGNQKRTDNFREDPSVETGTATLKDYRGSGWDRGHLAPAGDMKFSYDAMSESFFMSNIAPQAPGFNRYGWKDLESLVREYAVFFGSVLIVTGPILTTPPLGTIGTSSVSIPAGFYKAVLSRSGGIAFIMPNNRITEPLMYYACSLDEAERITGIDFFPFLEDALESRIEAHFDPSQWPDN